MPDERQGDKVLVALQGSVAFIHVEGRGSFKISTALKEFGVAAIAQGSKSIVLDMAKCVGMDSTFMGVLAGLACKLRDTTGGEMILLSLSPRTRSLVATLGLDQIVQAYQAGETPEKYAQLEITQRKASELTAGESRLATTKTMLEAHEKLVEISPDNLPRFKDVLTFLREDLKKKTDAAPEQG